MAADTGMKLSEAIAKANDNYKETLGIDANAQKMAQKFVNGSQFNYGKEAEDAINLLRRATIDSEYRVDAIQDSQWVTETLHGNEGLVLDDFYDNRRFFSTNDRKFTDTSLGGHYAANPKPGYTFYADIPKPGLFERNTPSVLAGVTNQGMGEYYSRAIDDSARYIHMRFGKPEYNSLIGFFSTFYSAKDAIIANTGRPPGWAFYVGKGAGLVAGHILLGTTLFFGLLAVSYLGGAINNIVNTNASKFYYSRPCMPVYWATVSHIVNQIMTYKGVFPIYNNDPKIGETQEYDSEMHESLISIMPDVFGTEGFIDVYAIMNRAERMNKKLTEIVKQRLTDGATIQDFDSGRIKLTSEDNKAITDAARSGSTLTQIVSKYLGTYNSAQNQSDTNQAAASSNTMLANGTAPAAVARENRKAENSQWRKYEGQDLNAGENQNVEPGFFDRFKDLLSAELSDGAAFATFRVDHQGSVSESFSSSTRPSDLGQKINSTSSQARSAYFTFAGGNTGVPGLDAVMGAAKEFVTGALSMLSLDGILSLAGSSFTDIPDHWENSVANLPSMSYTMRLQAPYGHPVSQLQNIYIPLAMILAGALPHAAGLRSYTQPFLVELFDPGFATTRTGIITSLTINRGVSNLGFNKNKEMLSCDVQFEVKDLTSIMYVPITAGLGLDPRVSIHGIDTTWTDYLSVLSGATLAEQIYTGKKLKIRAKNWYRNAQQVVSADYWAGVLRNNTVGDIVSLFANDTGRGDR